jgi:hypothetical protein
MKNGAAPCLRKTTPCPAKRSVLSSALSPLGQPPTSTLRIPTLGKDRICVFDR